MEYGEKLKDILQQLPRGQQIQEREMRWLEQAALSHRLTFQEIRILHSMLIDFNMWEANQLERLQLLLNAADTHKDKFMQQCRTLYEKIKASPISYDIKKAVTTERKKFTFGTLPKEDKILGTCPVASDKTLCCNLMTLDAARNCAFDCHYCSIRSFYPDDKILLESNLNEKLKELQLAPDKIYHIGTGQSSDSLIWGNRQGILDDLTAFARNNSNVILEMKSKSNNISHFKDKQIPRNMIFTWSLNPQIVIDNEEKNTSSLTERIAAARAMADNGSLVGFHFHPMLAYENADQDYADIARSLMQKFSPQEIATISFGTLTFTKKTMRLIRARSIKSKVLQLPLQTVAGKFSTPLSYKIALFKNIFDVFSPWKKQVFFYFCMEEREVWENIFGFSYNDNLDFEQHMKAAYMEKIAVKKIDTCSF